MERETPGVVLDTSAVIALLRDDVGAAEVEEVLRRERARMSTVNVAEAIDVLVRMHAARPEDVVTHVDELLSTVIEPVEPSVDHALRAGELRARVFARRDARVSLADCFVVATAEPGDRIATADATLARVARGEGLEVLDLPTARGRRR